MQGRNNRKLEQLEYIAQLFNGAKFLRFGFFFYAFISFVFWFLNCLDVDWLYLFAPLFQIPYQFVSTFYKPQGVSADFSLAIIGGLALGVGFIFDFVANVLYNNVIEQIEIERRKLRARQQARRRVQKRPLPRQTEENGVPTPDAQVATFGAPLENSKLLFLIMPHLNKIKKKKDDLELTFQEVEVWKQRINKRLIENLSYSKPLQKGYYRKNLFLMYKEFNYVDDFVYYISPTIDSIILEFKKYGIKISFCYILSAISQVSALEKELDCMDTILALNFFDEFIVTNRFKINYDNKPIHKYALEFKGEYNLSKNLSISNKQPIYILVKEKKNDNESNKTDS